MGPMSSPSPSSLTASSISTFETRSPPATLVCGLVRTPAESGTLTGAARAAKETARSAPGSASRVSVMWGFLVRVEDAQQTVEGEVARWTSEQAYTARAWGRSRRPRSVRRASVTNFLPVDGGEGAARAGEEETLLQVAAEALEGIALLSRLDTLGEDGDAEILAERGDRFDELRLGRFAMEVANQGDVELRDLSVELHEARQSGVAGAEIIDCNRKSHLFQPVDPRSGVRYPLEPDALGDLQNRPRRHLAQWCRRIVKRGIE